MADVYKFRVTIDLELATHETTKAVREYLRRIAENLCGAERAHLDRGGPRDVIDRILQFDIRTKRLDDWAPIGPDLTLRIAAGTCPHCATPFAPLEIHRLPFTCPHCRKVIRVDGTGTVIG